MQERQSTEVQDLINKFTETWPDVKVRQSTTSNGANMIYGLAHHHLAS